jgi:hypothetical protein
LKFAKVGSAATLLQQKKGNSIDVQRARVNVTGCICAVPTAAFVHVLVLLAAGFALCFGESIY